jgi:hypothetical protein
VSVCTSLINKSVQLRVLVGKLQIVSPQEVMGELGMVVHACNPSTQEVEAGGF